MAQLDVFKIEYQGIGYDASSIPDVFTDSGNEIIIGSHSLNLALYDDEKGWPDDEAVYIDEQIYAFIRDEYFHLRKEYFLEKVQKYLD